MIAINSDKNGNENNTGTLVLQFDYRNRLRKVTRPDGSLVSAYSYDALDRRINKSVTNSSTLNGSTRYCLDGHQEIEERTDQIGHTQYVYGRYVDELLIIDRHQNGVKLQDDEGQRVFCHQNRQYSVFALTNLKGKIVEGYQYEAYGARTVFNAGSSGVVTFTSADAVSVGGSSALGNPFGFTGRRLDSKSGLYYYRSRYMDPVQGRFISRDSLGFGSGSANPYEYVGGAPTRDRDPSGALPKWAGSIISQGLTIAKEKFWSVACTKLKVTQATCENLKAIGDFFWETFKSGELGWGQILSLMKYDVVGLAQANNPEFQLNWANQLPSRNGATPLQSVGGQPGNTTPDGNQNMSPSGPASVSFSRGTTIYGSTGGSTTQGTTGLSGNTGASNNSSDNDDDLDGDATGDGILADGFSDAVLNGWMGGNDPSSPDASDDSSDELMVLSRSTGRN